MPPSEAWLLPFLLLLSPGFLESSRYLYSEVIVPRQMESRDTFESQADLSYTIVVEGNHTVVRLTQTSFITSNMPVYSYNMKGDLITDYPYIQDDCYYSGYVEDVLDSQVILSTCTGLWGHLQIGIFRYEIKPIENSGTFQHLLYRKAPEHQEPCRGVLEDGADLASRVGELRMIDPGSLIPPFSNVEHYTSIRYLEYYAVIDKSKFIAEKCNETGLVTLVVQMMANVHTMFFGMGLRVYLVGLELWMWRDHITIHADSLSRTLTGFYQYVTHELQYRVRLDHAGIITSHGSPLGLAWGERYCVYNHASVSAMRSQDDMLSDGLNIAHQLGHSLGFGHDDAPEYAGHNCDCNCTQNGKCIMVASLSDVKCHKLSNCSRVIYHDLIRQPGKECLLNIPTQRFEPEICGNGVIDENEECDCGLDEETEDESILSLSLQRQPNIEEQPQWAQRSENEYPFANRPQSRDMTECRRHGCCQKNCTIKQDIDCIYGLCCEKCKFLEKGTLCREPETECDLPEYCNGTAASCPTDVYKQDGMPCGIANTCYMGKCLSLQQQCTDIFGHGTQPAPLICFKEVNMQGDRSGNCGEESSLRFKKCNEEDVPCGRVQCTHVSKLPKMPIGQGVVQTAVADTLCWGTEFHLGKDVYDIGAVRDGTTCGINRVCINRSCVDRAVLKYDCDFSKCNNRGLCNSRRNCHCMYGWAPPFCKITGFGGSIDSGPPPHVSLSLVLLGAILLMAGLLLLALLCFAILRKEQLIAWWLARRSLKRPPSPMPANVQLLRDPPSKGCLVVKGQPSKGGLALRGEQSRVTFAT